MATINNTNLSISRNNARDTVKPKVTFTVRFTQLEMSLMEQGLRFRLECKLWGDDSFSDDHLYTYSSKYFPDSSPSRSESAEFEVTLGGSVLDED